MDQLDVIRSFRRRLAAPKPGAKARARRLLQERMTAAAPAPARLRMPRGVLPRDTVSVAAITTAIAGALAAVLLVQGPRNDRPPAQPEAIAAQPSPARAQGSLPVSSSYRDYLQFASRMTRLELRTGVERADRLLVATSLCAQAQLAEIERLAIEALSAAGWPRGRPVLDGGVAIELAESVDERSACRYAGFGIERARAVYGGLLPVSNLMPDAQSALPGLGLVGKPLL